MDVVNKEKTLTDVILAAVAAKLNARRGELDATQFGELEFSFEIKDNAPAMMKLVLVETATKKGILECAAIPLTG